MCGRHADPLAPAGLRGRQPSRRDARARAHSQRGSGRGVPRRSAAVPAAHEAGGRSVPLPSRSVEHCVGWLSCVSVARAGPAEAHKAAAGEAATPTGWHTSRGHSRMKFVVSGDEAGIPQRTNPSASPIGSVDSPICPQLRFVIGHLIADDAQPEWHVGHSDSRSGRRSLPRHGRQGPEVSGMQAAHCLQSVPGISEPPSDPDGAPDVVDLVGKTLVAVVVRVGRLERHPGRKSYQRAVEGQIGKALESRRVALS